MSRIRDRETAGHQLALRLARLRDRDALVLVVPRSGVPIARVIADELDADLDVILVRRLGAPGQPELTLGAIDEQGEVVWNPGASRLANESFMVEEAGKHFLLLRSRRLLYTPGRGPLPIKGRSVVLVDDGVATGATLESAIRSVRRRGAAEVIVAVGVMSSTTLRHFERLADRVVCLISPEDLYSVGGYYVDFRQVSDEEVVDVLRASEVGAISHIAGA